MYILAIKKMPVNEIRDFIFENYYKRNGFSKESSYYSMKSLKRKDLLLLGNKLIEKVLDPRNNKEHYESFLRKKNRKLVKQPGIITYQLKTFGKPNIYDIKSVITEHPEASHKLTKTIRKDKKLDFNSSFYSDKKNVNIFLTKRI